jgi:TonB-dependent SusC/RagA subfamily outer membrane receptor
MKRILTIAFFLTSVINGAVIFAENNETARGATFNETETTKTSDKKTAKADRKKKKGTVQDTLFIRGIADQTVAIPMDGADHVTISVTDDSLRVQQGKKKVARPSSRYGGYMVTRSELEKTGEMYLLKAIAMKVPGVRMLGDNLQIRGVSTFNSTTAPLYLVDGVETGYVTHLLVSEVDNVEVLKDSSTSMFGMKGANGVVLINRVK